MIQAQVYVVKDREKTKGGTGLLVGIDPQRELAVDGRNLREVQERYLGVLSSYCRHEGCINEYLTEFPELPLSALEKAASRDEPVKLRDAGRVIVSQETGDHLNYLKKVLKERNTDLKVWFYVEFLLN